MNRVLITPLDWGLGHATRCIPVIRELLSRGCDVFIAGNGDSLALLKNEFPALTYFILPGYNPVYSTQGRMIAKMILQIPKFMDVINKEHTLVESIVQTNKIDLIISDNRYGCWSAQVPCIFMTHQLNIQIPFGFRWLSKVVTHLNRRLIRKFSACWIPDYPDRETNLSGDLSAADAMGSGRFIHIGPLSRFHYPIEREIEYDVACILSGPEPQRSIFEDMVVGQLKASGLRYIVVRGVLAKTHPALPNTTAFLNSEALQRVISKSSLIIARSGYSTIMDLAAVRKKAIVVPTPGQTEQEYLAERWGKRKVLHTMTQENFDLHSAMKETSRCTGFKKPDEYPTELLKRELDRVLTSKTLLSSFAK